MNNPVENQTVLKAKFMKIQLLMCTVFVLFICLFSAKTFAQAPPEPGGDPLIPNEIKSQIVKIVPFQLSPILSYKKNSIARGIDGAHFKMKIYFVSKNWRVFMQECSDCHQTFMSNKISTV